MKLANDEGPREARILQGHEVRDAIRPQFLAHLNDTSEFVRIAECIADCETNDTAGRAPCPYDMTPIELTTHGSGASPGWI
jgi:hypothetical protein